MISFLQFSLDGQNLFSLLLDDNVRVPFHALPSILTSTRSPTLDLWTNGTQSLVQSTLNVT